MTAKCTVIEVKKDGTAIVCAERKSACAECHAAGGGKTCGACDIFLGDDKFTAEADNSIGAKAGDTVTVESPSGYVIASAALLFILPIVIAALFYGAVYMVYPEYAPIGALCGIILCYAVIFLIEKITKKKKSRMKIVKILNEKSGGINNAH